MILYCSFPRCYHWGEPGEGVPEISYNYTGVCKYLKIELKKNGGEDGRGREERKRKEEGNARGQKSARMKGL